MRTSSARLTLHAVLLVATLFPLAALAQTVFIPASGRTDMAYDPARDVLYVTAGSQILRYRMATRSFLAPWTFSKAGTDLGGIDLSPDGKTVVVADRLYEGDWLWAWAVDADTGNREQQLLPRGYYAALGGTSLSPL